MLIERIRRARGRAPGEIARRAIAEFTAQAERLRGDPLGETLPGELLERLGSPDVDKLWEDLAARSHPAVTQRVDPGAYEAAAPGDRERILKAAEAVLNGVFPVACCGELELALPIAWNRDPVSGHSWPNRFFRDLDLLDLDRDSDVRRVWEVSRLQWLIPVGQAFLLTGDERYASFAEAVFDDWMHANPYGYGVNWAVAMEPAMRIFTWTWFFHVFSESQAWTDAEFRARFMAKIFRQSVFVSRHIENWGIGGNHLIADAAALVVAGLYFGDAPEPKRWQARGWRILCGELESQVLADGVDVEASLAYHRLVFELLYWAAAYRIANGLEVPSFYRDTLSRMAEFSGAATAPDGCVPAWGDSDDARVFTFGTQPVRDHRYLAALQLALEGHEDPIETAPSVASEVAWSIGIERIGLRRNEGTSEGRAFDDGGICVLRGSDDHVFFDCGPVGFGGRGGHGHNDCLGFDAVLDGVPVITDSGTYGYSADVEWRNRFRGTAAHATPMIDNAEQNRILPAPDLWRMHADTDPEIRRCQFGANLDLVEASHSGYQRLPQPVTVVRTIVLDKQNHRLIVADKFEGQGRHLVDVNYPLAPNAKVVVQEAGWFRVEVDGKTFDLAVPSFRPWKGTVEEGWYSPRYGERVSRPVIRFHLSGELVPLLIGIGPALPSGSDPRPWISDLLERNG